MIIMQMGPEFQSGFEAGNGCEWEFWGPYCKEMINGMAFLCMC